jgi:hypothetical protein
MLGIILKWPEHLIVELLLYAYIAIPLTFNPLNAELNPICHLLVLLGTHLILHVSRIRVENRAFYI